jgi:hypothetical protein
LRCIYTRFRSINWLPICFARHNAATTTDCRCCQRYSQAQKWRSYGSRSTGRTPMTASVTGETYCNASRMVAGHASASLILTASTAGHQPALSAHLIPCFGSHASRSRSPPHFTVLLSFIY